MLTDIEIKRKGLKVLVEQLGDLEAEKFISLIIKEPFDYTTWQKKLWPDKTIEEISEAAMKQKSKKE